MGFWKTIFLMNNPGYKPVKKETIMPKSKFDRKFDEAWDKHVAEMRAKGDWNCGCGWPLDDNGDCELCDKHLIPTCEATQCMDEPTEIVTFESGREMKLCSSCADEQCELGAGVKRRNLTPKQPGGFGRAPAPKKPTSCPECHSTHITPDDTNELWQCDMCTHTFTA